MAESIEQARSRVQQCFDDIVALAETDERRTLWEFEKSAWPLLLALGRAIVMLVLARHLARPRPATYKRDGIRWVLRDERTTDLV